MSPAGRTPSRSLPLLLVAAALLSLAGCAKEPERNLAPVMVARKPRAVPPGTPAAPAPPGKGAAAPAAPGKAVSPAAPSGKDNAWALPVFPAGELYNPAGKRNPFLPFLRASRGGGEGKGGREMQKVPPLQRADLSEFRYVGILKTRKGTQALVETSDGKGYSVQLGSRLGRDNGVVTDITTKQITVRESSTDEAGKTTVREVLIRNKNANAGGKR